MKKTEGATQRFDRSGSNKIHTNVPKVSSVMFSITFFIIVFSLLSSPTYADYEENIREGIFLVQPSNQYLAERTVPTYLSTEDMTFFACIEYADTPVRLSVLCSDDNNFIDVSATRWGPENCYVGSVNLEQFSCQRAVVVADYVRSGENQRLTKNVRINKVTGSLQRILDGQFLDGGWSSALDTAFALFSIKPFEDVFEERINKGIDYLKQNRDEDDKCWPQEQCQLSTTANIAYLLAQADYDDESRVLRDAATYLSKTMSYIYSGETYTLTIIDHSTNYNNSVNTSCVYAYGSLNLSVELPRYPTETNFTISPSYDVPITAVCTENILATLTSSVRGTLFNYAGDNFTYSIPGPCWTYNNENITCDLRATAYAVAAPIDSDRKAAVAAYLASQFSTTVLGDALADSDVMTASIIIAASDSSELASEQKRRIINNLLYRQSNEGYWNATANHYDHSFFEPTTEYVLNFSHVLNDDITRNVVYTGFAVEGLLKNDYTRDSESIIDAENWLSDNEALVTRQLSEEEAQVTETVEEYNKNVTEIINDPKRNSMALYVLQQNTRPFLKSSPRIIVLDRQNITVDLINPTTFSLEGLTYELPSELTPYVRIEEKDTFAPYSFRRIEIQQVGEVSSELFGYLRIQDGTDEYAKIPFILTSAPSIQISFPTDMTVFGNAAVMPLNVTKSAHNFSCVLRWRDGGITSISSFNIDREGIFSLPIQFTQSVTEERIYSGELACSAVTSTFNFPFSVPVTRFISRPISVAPSIIDITEIGVNGHFTVKNLLDESIDVVISFRDAVEFVELSDFFINMYPGEIRNITVTVTAPSTDNVSIVNSIIVRSFNVEERIPLTIELIGVPEKITPLWLVATYWIFGVGLAGLLGYFVYTNRSKLYELYKKRVKKKSYYDDIKHSVEDYEKKEAAMAIKNLTSILKMQGLPDKEIRARLVAQGFTEEEITTSLKMRFETPSKTSQVPGAKPPSSGAQGGAQQK